MTEVQRLAPKRVHVAGGPSVVSEAVVAQLHTAVPAATISRLGGADRYETAALLSQAFVNSASMAVVATA